MEMTSTVGNRDWLASSENLDLQISIPKNFLHHDLLEFSTPSRNALELEVELSAYIFECAGSLYDLDPAFENAAIETWLASEND